MPPPHHHHLLLFLFLLLHFITTTTALSSSHNATTTTFSTSHHHLSPLCSSTPHPAACLSALKLSVSISISISPLFSSALLSLLAAISSLPPLPAFPAVPSLRLGALRDCSDLHHISLASLRRSADLLRSPSPSLPTLNAHLSAALTNKRTCLDGLAGATSDGLPSFIRSLSSAYDHVSNALSLVSRDRRPSRRRLLGFPPWLSRRRRRILQDGNGDDQALSLVVAKDGRGNFSTVGEAVRFAPSNSVGLRTFIWIKAGVYEENVDIPADKMNIVMLGDGRDVTVIRGSRSAAKGWTAFSSATVGVSGQGFLARDITFENVAGTGGGQATALRVNADMSAFYRCTISGFQDTHYVHSFRQFYRECNIYGTVDFIYGNAAVVFQSCNLLARLPIPGQSNVITAQSRDDPNEDTGISIDRCSITAADDLAAKPNGAKTFLGRPWLPYSRTVVMESFIDGLVDPAGWLNWEGDQGLDTLYYGEYDNNGPGSDTSNRVDWPGYHEMSYDEAVGFTVPELINGDDWLGDTSFPYDDGV